MAAAGEAGLEMKPHRRLLVTLNRIVAILSILVAVLLYTGEKTLGVPDLAQAPWHEPLIVHCLLTALLLLVVNARLKRAAATGEFAGMAEFALSTLIGPIGIVEFLLAFEALSSDGPGWAWALLLGLHGVSYFWSALAVFARPSRRETPPADSVGPEGGMDPRVLAAAEQSRRAPPALSPATFAAILTAPLAVVMAFYFPMVYFKFFERALFEQRFDGWAAFFESVVIAIDKQALLAATMAALMFGFALWGAILGWLQARRDAVAHRDAGRALSFAELALIGEAARRLARFADQFDVKDHFRGLTMMLILIGAGAGFAIATLVLSGARGPGMGWLEAQRTAGLSWFLYIDGLGAGDTMLIVTGLLAAFCLLLIFAGRIRRLAIMGALGMRRNKLQEDDPWSYYRLAIAADVRRGRLKQVDAFDPEAYVRADFRRFAGGVYILTGIFIALNSVFLYLDRMDYDLLTEDYIETTEYLRPGADRFSYGDVTEVAVACARDDDLGLDFVYRLQLPDGGAVDVLISGRPRRLRSWLPYRLQAWEKVDAKLRAAAVPVRHLPPRGQTPRFDAEKCRDELEYYLGSDVAARVMPLLRETSAAPRVAEN